MSNLQSLNTPSNNFQPNNIQSQGALTAQTRLAANDLAAKLLAAEAAIDAAIAAVASLTAAMPVAAQQANIGMHVGHEALMHAMESCQSLVKSRTNIIRTHKALRIAQSDVGLDHVAFLPLCPPDQASLTPAFGPLSAVAA
jgi:hypothetical protein